MSDASRERIDEVNRYYEPIKTITAIGSGLFWVIAALSLCMLYVASIGKSAHLTALQTVFIVLVLVDFGLSQI